MKRNPMSLKAIINNIAKENKDNFYAKDILYEDLIESLKYIGEIYR